MAEKSRGYNTTSFLGGDIMAWYCEKCKKLHKDEEMCPHICKQLRKSPELLVDAANFIIVAGQYGLVTSNALNVAAQQTNKLIGTDLTYEGTKQFARDIQVFKRLNEEAFVRCGVFSSPEKAQNYLNNATAGQLKNIVAKINGSGQEIDWLREQQSNISNLIYKSELLNKNAVGVDSVVYNRFTGKEITRVTIKATQSQDGLNTNVQQVVKAVKLNRLNPNETAFGVEGTKQALLNKLDKEIKFAEQQGDFGLAERLREAKSLKVIEYNSPKEVKVANERIKDKIAEGQATTYVTPEQLGDKMCDGAVIGAVVGLTVSAITSYIRYRNGELTRQEAFSQITEDTLKSAIIGAGMSAVTIFLPGGIIGFIGGMAVGIYMNAICINILDEVFGKGSYAAILNASGYIYGMTTNLETSIRTIDMSMHKTRDHLKEAKDIQQRIDSNLVEFAKELEGLL